jgi:hypothetical protein
MDCSLPLALLLGMSPPTAALPASCNTQAQPQVVQVATTSARVSAISREPLYADLVRRARRLKRETETFDANPSVGLLSDVRFQAYTQDIRALSDGDQKGHLDLKARGTDRDLKCILKGVSLDLNTKMDAIAAAKTDAGVATALTNMAALLSDNIDVIVTPATTESGLDCVIEFGNS